MTGTDSASSSADRKPAARGPRVLLDTNAVLLPFTRHFPLEAEIERLIQPPAPIQIPRAVGQELETLTQRKVRGARMALAWSRKFPQLPTSGRGDAAILRVARPFRDWVVTADTELQARLVSAGISVLVPRDRHRLELRPGRMPTGRARRRRRRAATVKSRLPVD